MSLHASRHSLTIPDFDPKLAERLRQRAARNGQSIQAEARLILQAALETSDEPPPTDFYERVRARFSALGGVDLVLPEREPARDPPGFV